MSQSIVAEPSEPLTLRERLLLKDKDLSAPLIEKVLGKVDPVRPITVELSDDDEIVYRPRRRQLD